MRRSVYIDKSLRGATGLSERNDIMKRTETTKDGSKITFVYLQDQKKGVKGIKQKFLNFVDGVKHAKDSAALAQVFDKHDIGCNSKKFRHIREGNAIFDQKRISQLGKAIDKAIVENNKSSDKPKEILNEYIYSNIEFVGKEELQAKMNGL